MQQPIVLPSRHKVEARTVSFTGKSTKACRPDEPHRCGQSRDIPLEPGMVSRETKKIQIYISVSGRPFVFYKPLDYLIKLTLPPGLINKTELYSQEGWSVFFMEEGGVNGGGSICCLKVHTSTHISHVSILWEHTHRASVKPLKTFQATGTGSHVTNSTVVSQIKKMINACLPTQRHHKSTYIHCLTIAGSTPNSTRSLGWILDRVRTNLPFDSLTNEVNVLT